MIYKKNNFRKSKFELKFNIFVVVTCIALCIIVFKYLNVLQKSSNNHRNMFYVQIINYSMPVVEKTCFDEEDMLENQFTLKKVALNMFGINYVHPARLMNREVSCMTDKNEVDIKQVANNENNSYEKINGFTINDKDVDKEAKTKPKKDNQPQKSNEKVNVYDPKLKQKLNMSKPRVFIYHTHTCESYKPSKSTNKDPKTSVCAVGDELQKELQEKYGISVVHDKTIHDAYAYTKSYSRSGVTVDKYLKKYGGFEMVIDIHRDAIENKSAVTTQINGKNVAKIMFVMSRNNPHFQKNMSMVNKLVSISKKDFPKLCKGIYFYNHGNRCFNQNKSNNATLIEVGSHVNNISESKNTGDCLARIIAEYLKSK